MLVIFLWSVPKLLTILQNNPEVIILEGSEYLTYLKQVGEKNAPILPPGKPSSDPAKQLLDVDSQDAADETEQDRGDRK